MVTAPRRNSDIAVSAVVRMGKDRFGRARVSGVYRQSVKRIRVCGIR